MSLVEVVIALGAFAILATGVIGALTAGVDSARFAKTDYQIYLLAENLQSRLLLEGDWPDSGASGQTILHVDELGREVDREEAVYQIRLQVVPNPNWQGSFLQTLEAEFLTPQEVALERFTLSRAVTSPIQ